MQIDKIVLINDHKFKSGIGKYSFNLYDQFLKHQNEHFQFQLLLQNVPLKDNREEWRGLESGKFPPDEQGILEQTRPRWAKQSGFGKMYQITSFYYFPRKLPTGYSLYHISSQMMGNIVNYVSPTVVTCHDLISLNLKSNHRKISQHFRLKHLNTLTNATGIIFISRYTRNSFLENFNYKEEKTAVVHHGISEIFKPMDKAVCRKNLGIALDRPVVLFVGGEEFRKNIRTLLQVIYELKKGDPAILLVRVGDGRSGTRRLISELSLDDNVVYFNDQSEAALAQFYNAADVFLFPSMYEGFGMPVLEALKSGCPVVASNATSIPEITSDAAILLDPLDVDGFTDAAESILCNASLAGQMSKAGLERARQFSWENTFQETIKMYSKILNR